MASFFMHCALLLCSLFLLSSPHLSLSFLSLSPSFLSRSPCHDVYLLSAFLSPPSPPDEEDEDTRCAPPMLRGRGEEGREEGGNWGREGGRERGEKEGGKEGRKRREGEGGGGGERETREREREREGASGCSSSSGPGGELPSPGCSAETSMGGCVGSHHDSSGSLNENSDGTGGNLQGLSASFTAYQLGFLEGGLCVCECARARVCVLGGLPLGFLHVVLAGGLLYLPPDIRARLNRGDRQGSPPRVSPSTQRASKRQNDGSSARYFTNWEIFNVRRCLPLFFAVDWASRLKRSLVSLLASLHDKYGSQTAMACKRERDSLTWIRSRHCECF